ncbi:hypothetical protein WA026_012479 [Henosepilachna vigintioctopunctata]|uniref:Uncharacterized protein n=1 Tax=Henosepilachna vigintioctopunctata TaxID=420089 RepID=A0AAW1UXX0_9CUCU
MPKRLKGANLSRRTINSRAVQDIRARKLGEQIQENNTGMRESMVQLRESQSQEARDERNQQRQRKNEEKRADTWSTDVEELINNANKLIEHLHQIYFSISSPVRTDVEYYAHSKVVIGTLEK